MSTLHLGALPLGEGSSSSTPAWVAVAIAAVAAAVSLTTFALAGRRARLDRQRQVFAEAFQAAMEYREYPHIVRRRSSDDPAGERRRISSALSDVQARLNAYQARLRIEDPFVGKRYGELVAETRRVAGGMIKQAWNEPPADDDAAIHAPASFDFSPLAPSDDAYLQAVKDHLSLLPASLLRRLPRRQNARPSAQ